MQVMYHFCLLIGIAIATLSTHVTNKKNPVPGKIQGKKKKKPGIE